MAVVPYEWFTVFNDDPSPSYVEPELNCGSQDYWLVKVDSKKSRSYVTLVQRKDRSATPIEAVCFMASCVWPVTFRVGQKEEVPYCEDFNTVVFYSRRNFSGRSRFKYVPRAFSLDMTWGQMNRFRCPSSEVTFDFDVSGKNNSPRRVLSAKVSNCNECHPDEMTVYVFDFYKWDFTVTYLNWGDDLVKIHEGNDNNFMFVYIDLLENK